MINRISMFLGTFIIRRPKWCRFGTLICAPIILDRTRGSFLKCRHGFPNRRPIGVVTGWWRPAIAWVFLSLFDELILTPCWHKAGLGILQRIGLRGRWSWPSPADCWWGLANSAP